MNSAAGAPLSIWRASAELAAYDTRVRTPVACSRGRASSSSAVCSDAAAKTSTGLLCCPATVGSPVTTSRTAASARGGRRQNRLESPIRPIIFA